MATTTITSGTRILNVNPHDVTTNHEIPFFFSNVTNKKDQIESGKNGGHQINVFGRRFEIVVSTKDWIGGCQDRCSAVQHRGDSSLCHTNGLLFHGFMNRYTILWSHLVKLVDAYNTAVTQNHGPSLQVPF
jgi:hypothetical protein